jgi:hypothetical protein
LVFSNVVEFTDFERVQKTIALAPTQSLPLDATMGPAAIAETVNVVGRTTNVLTQTATVATNVKQDLVSMLPTTRDITTAVLFAPAVHASGPNGNVSIGDRCRSSRCSSLTASP